MGDFAARRRRMVENDIARRGVRDARVLAALGEVPREAFVAPDLAALAYDDRPLCIGERQTISQPYMVALMLEAAELRPGDRALEVGTGSGYGAAVMSRLVARVFTIERHAALAEAAAARLAALGHDNVETRVGDGGLGWPEAAPFDAILVAAAGPSVPEALKRQLAPRGRLIMPVGPVGGQSLIKLTRGENADEVRNLGHVAFVPLIGAGGFAETASRPNLPGTVRQWFGRGPRPPR